jgi:Asp-tRNA(Asn)/Glu-tRNA(Gln) amidotransferase A subunit family amidase
VADLRLLFDVMSGSAGSSPPDISEGPIRVAQVRGFFAGDVHPVVLAAVEHVISVLDGAGVGVGDPGGEDADSLRVFERARRVWNRTCFPEFSEAHRAIDRTLVSKQPRTWMERGDGYAAEEREEAARRRAAIREWFLRELAQVDALVVPTCPYPAPRADQEEVELTPGHSVKVEEIGPGWLTCTVNLAGLPALSLPAARSTEGLPIGVSLIGRPDEEHTLLALAGRWERASGHRPTRPALPPGTAPPMPA